MKKLVITLVILAVIFGLWSFRKRIPVYTTKKDVTPSDNISFRPDPSSATFLFDDEAVTLSGGKNERRIDPQSNTTEETNLLDKIAYGDINADKKDDAVVFLSQDGGGTGTFLYVAAFVSGPISYKGSNAMFLGDRVSPQSIDINNNVITVKYLDRGPDEPLASTPTILKIQEFVFDSGELRSK